MQKEDLVKFIFVIVLIILSIHLAMLKINLQDAAIPRRVFASSSPSFQQQDIILGSGHCIDAWSEKPLQNNPDCVNIQSISYSSDGKYLNATLWLKDFVENPIQFESVDYGMYIDTNSDNRTGIGAISYRIEIDWNTENHAWSRVFEEWSPTGQTKTLDKEDIGADYFQSNGKFVDLFANLAAMTSPEHYKVLFYAEVFNGTNHTIDSTDWISVPSPKLSLTMSPNPIVLTQGEQTTAELTINSSAIDGLDIDLHPKIEQNISNDQNIMIKADSEKLHLSSNGVASTHLHISVPSDIEPSEYVIDMPVDMTPVTANLFAEPKFAQSNDLSVPNNSLNPSKFAQTAKEQTFSQSSIFSLQVKKWALDEQLGNFVDHWITPFTTIYTGISAITRGILGWVYGRKHQ